MITNAGKFGVLACIFLVFAIGLLVPGFYLYPYPTAQDKTTLLEDGTVDSAKDSSTDKTSGGRTIRSQQSSKNIYDAMIGGGLVCSFLCFAFGFIAWWFFNNPNFDNTPTDSDTDENPSASVVLHGAADRCRSAVEMSSVRVRTQRDTENESSLLTSPASSGRNYLQSSSESNTSKEDTSELADIQKGSTQQDTSKSDLQMTDQIE